MKKFKGGYFYKEIKKWFLQNPGKSQNKVAVAKIGQGNKLG